MLGSEIWEENFAALLSPMKEFIVDVWEVRKKNSIVMSHALVDFSQFSAGDLGPVAGVGGAGLVSWVSLLIHVIWVSYVWAMLMIIMCILVIRCAASPIIVDVLSMAVLLGQCIDYSYYYALFMPSFSYVIEIVTFTPCEGDNIR